MKVVLQLEGDALKELKAVSLLSKSKDNELKITFSNDRAPKERDHMKKLRDRIKDGETNTVSQAQKYKWSPEDCEDKKLDSSNLLPCMQFYYKILME